MWRDLSQIAQIIGYSIFALSALAAAGLLVWYLARNKYNLAIRFT
jgi:hypothetical protein